MTWDNPNPFANPLNVRKYSNFSLARGDRQEPMIHINKKDLQVPNQDVPMYGSEEWNELYNKQASLEVPNQDIPLGDQLQGNGFIPGHDDLFRLADGTVLSFKTGKIVYQKKNNAPDGYWSDEVIERSSEQYEPSQDEFVRVMSQAINYDPTKSSAENEYQAMKMNVDPRSAKYWIQADIEANKLKSKMTDKQKKMIQDFEGHFPVSQLIEEAKRNKIKQNILK